MATDSWSARREVAIDIEQREDLRRVGLSRDFFLRDFLYSDLPEWHSLRNGPDFPDVAVKVGQRLCEELLEPIQATFGLIEIRSAYRSTKVNVFGNVHRLNCASNEANFTAHFGTTPMPRATKVPWHAS